MRRSTFIAFAVCCALVLVAFLHQRSRIATLDKEATSLRGQLQHSSGSPQSSGGRRLSSGASRPTPDQRKKHSRSDRIPSVATLRALWPAGAEQMDRTAATLTVPRLVAAVEGCSTEQLLELATGLGGTRPGSNSNERFLQKLLVILASEDDPEAALETWDNLREGKRFVEGVRASLLNQLAKVDPDLALRRLEPEGYQDRPTERSYLAVAQQLLRTDVPKALELLSERHLAGWASCLNGLAYAEHNTAITVAAAIRDPKVEEALWQEVNARRTTCAVLEGLVYGIALRDGIEAASEAFARVENPDDRVANLVLKHQTFNLQSVDPIATFSLVYEHARGDYREEALSDAIRGWASADLPSADRWLRDQPPSLDRDRITVGYIKDLLPADPESAAEWIEGINNDDLRAEALKRYRQVVREDQ